MTNESFFEAEPRLAVHLASMFCPLSSEFITRFAEDLSWPGIALNEHIVWSEAFIVERRSQLEAHRLFQNPAIVWTDSMRAMFGLSTAPARHPYAEASTIGDVLAPWARATFDKARPLASLTAAEAMESPGEWLWEPLLTSSFTPWTADWSRALSRVAEVPHRNVSNLPLRCLRRVYDDVCAPELGASPEAFLTEFFAREPHYDACAVSTDDAHGVPPTVRIDASAYAGWRDGERVPVAVNPYAQGPRRSVAMSDVQMLSKGACIVIDRAWRETFASLVLPPHSFHEVALAPTKKLAGDPVLLRFDDVFVEGATLPAPYDLLIARRANTGARFFGLEILMSRRAARLVRQMRLPNVTFSSARSMRLSIASDASASRPLPSLRVVDAPAIAVTEAQSFYAAKRARLMATEASLPTSHKPSRGALGQAEARLSRVFPAGLAAFIERNGKKRIEGYRLLSPSKMYLLDSHGYELEHPESWGAVAIAENGVGDCIGLLLRKSSDHALGAKLYEFMQETGRLHRWSTQL